MEPDADTSPADESLLLGLIAGCCNQVPRDEDKLAVLLDQLRLAQRRRGSLAASSRGPRNGE